MDASSNLKGIVKVGAGLDAIDVSAATERGIVVRNGAGLNAQATAELAFSLILSVVRRIVPLAEEMRKGLVAERILCRRTFRSNTWHCWPWKYRQNCRVYGSSLPSKTMCIQSKCSG